MTKTSSPPKPENIPAQHQTRQPGREADMRPQPDYAPRYPGSGRLEGRRCLVTGGDSGIGRAVCVLFAREGADVAFVYLEETEDAEKTAKLIEAEGGKAAALRFDLSDEQGCADAVAAAVKALGGLDVLVNNVAEQHVVKDLKDIDAEQIERTFRTNIFSYLLTTKHALEHLKTGSAIVNTVSVTAYRGSGGLVDYAATRGAAVAFTRSLAKQLMDKGIRVNGVAPGPIWTPLIPASFPADEVEGLGEDAPMGRAGQPNEVAPCHLFLACEDASYMTGQVLHPNGGEIVGG